MPLSTCPSSAWSRSFAKRDAQFLVPHPKGSEYKMHYVIGSQLGWAATAVIFAIGGAYMWFVGRILNTKRTSGEVEIKQARRAA